MSGIEQNTIGHRNSRVGQQEKFEFKIKSNLSSDKCESFEEESFFRFSLVDLDFKMICYFANLL